MIIKYPVIFTKLNDAKDTYLIEIPDLKGITEGYGLADAIKMARDYIGCYCYDKNDIPVASDLNDIDISKGEFYNDGESEIILVDVEVMA